MVKAVQPCLRNDCYYKEKSHVWRNEWQQYCVFVFLVAQARSRPQNHVCESGELNESLSLVQQDLFMPSLMTQHLIHFACVGKTNRECVQTLVKPGKMTISVFRIFSKQDSAIQSAHWKSECKSKQDSLISIDSLTNHVFVVQWLLKHVKLLLLSRLFTHKVTWLYINSANHSSFHVFLHTTTRDM